MTDFDYQKLCNISTELQNRKNDPRLNRMGEELANIAYNVGDANIEETHFIKAGEVIRAEAV